MKQGTMILVLALIVLIGAGCGKKSGGNSNTTTVTCKVTADCKSGQICLPAQAGQAGICATSTVGATCKVDADCKTDETCQASICAKQTTDTPPTLEITSPVNNSTVTSPVTVEAKVSDAKGIDRVEFYLGGLIKATVKTAPYTWTAKMDPGTQVIKVKACNIVSLCVEKDVIIVVSNPTVADNPPTVAFTSPVTGATIKDAWSIALTANDDKAVTKVEVYLDNALLASLTAPYQWSGSATATANGNHTLKAIAYDSINQTAVTEIIVLVQNTPPDQPPSVTITNPTNGSVVATTTNITATANDDIGVSKVEIYIDNVLKATASSYSWNPRTVANGSHTIKVIAYDTANQTGTASINVTVANPVVASITITSPNTSDTKVFDPAGPVIKVPKEDGSNTQVYELLVTAKAGDGSTIADIPFSWSTADATIATYTQSGTYNERVTVATHKDWFDNGATTPIITLTVTGDSITSAVSVKSIINIGITSSNPSRQWAIAYNGSGGQVGYVVQDGEGFTYTNIPAGYTNGSGTITNNKINFTVTNTGGCIVTHAGTFSSALVENGTFTTDFCSSGTWAAGN